MVQNSAIIIREKGDGGLDQEEVGWSKTPPLLLEKKKVEVWTRRWGGPKLGKVPML